LRELTEHRFQISMWTAKVFENLQSNFDYLESAKIIFNEHLQGSGITINAMHPGNVKTNSGQYNGRLYKILKSILIDPFARPIEIAAEALYYLGVSSELDNISGKFFNLTTLEEPAPPALDKNAALRLWEISMNLGGIYEK